MRRFPVKPTLTKKIGLLLLLRARDTINEDAAKIVARIVAEQEALEREHGGSPV